MDDFGTGYSSLSYLKRFPIDTLKIDQSFVADLDSPDGPAIIDAIIALAKTLNLRVIAEGIENEQQLAYLVEKDCDLLQGFYFSQPIYPEEVADMLRRNFTTYLRLRPRRRARCEYRTLYRLLASRGPSRPCWRSRQSRARPGPNHNSRSCCRASQRPALRDLVEQPWVATVTHDLHIIDAVGALLTREQLDKALESPLISRYLDDLSISEQPEQDNRRGSRAGHARPAAPWSWTGIPRLAVTWRLYNKGSGERLALQANSTWHLARPTWARRCRN